VKIIEHQMILSAAKIVVLLFAVFYCIQFSKRTKRNWIRPLLLLLFYTTAIELINTILGQLGYSNLWVINYLFILPEYLLTMILLNRIIQPYVKFKNLLILSFILFLSVYIFEILQIYPFSDLLASLSLITGQFIISVTSFYSLFQLSKNNLETPFVVKSEFWILTAILLFALVTAPFFSLAKLIVNHDIAITLYLIVDIMFFIKYLLIGYGFYIESRHFK